MPFFQVSVAILALFTCAYGNEVTVSFQVIVPGTLSPLSNVYISSSLNGWSPSSPVWKMSQTGQRSFRLDISLAEGQEVEYLYTLGDRQCVETEMGGKPLRNRVIVIKKGLIQIDTVAQWKMQSVNVGRWLPTDVYYFQRKWLIDKLGLTPPASVYVENPVRRLTSVSQLDSLLKAVQTEWRTIAERDYGGVAPELLSALFSNVLVLIEDEALAPVSRDYVLEYYMLPALLREYVDLRSSTAKWKAGLLMYPLITLHHALQFCPLALNDSIPSREIPDLASVPARRMEQWKQMSAIFYELPTLVEQYLSDPSLVDESNQSSLIDLRLTLIYLKPCWQIQDHLVNHRLIEAFNELKKIAVKGKESVPSSEFRSIAYSVFQELARKRMSAEALEVADMLAAHQIRQFPPDPRGIAPLKPLYLDADSVYGEERYNLAIARHSSTQPVSHPSKTVARPLLSGRFLDLVSGDTLDLAALRGKIVVMEFWATWCGSCVSQIPFLKNYAKSLKSNQNTAFISVVCDLTTWDRGEGFISQVVATQGINYVVLVDPTEDPLSRRFSIQWYPSTVVIGRDGQIALKPQDAGDWRKVEQCVATIQSQ